MVDTEMLQGKMREKKYTIKELAEKMQLSPTGLFNKIHNVREFSLGEIQRMSKILSLDKKATQSIFLLNL